MDFTQVVLQIAVLFIIMLIGYYLRMKGIVTDDGVKNFTSLIFYVTMPAMIITAFSGESNQDNGALGMMLVASLTQYIFLGVVAVFMPRLLKVKKGSIGLYRFMTIFGNVAFIGLPMIIAIVGESAVYIAALVNMPFNLMLYTVGIYFIMSDKDPNHRFTFSIGKFMNPGIFATIIGLAVKLYGFKLPSVVTGIAGTLGPVTTPLAMIIVGASLYGVNIRLMFTNYRVIVFSFIRMLVFPICIGLILNFLQVEPLIMTVSMILSGMPIGTSTAIIAKQYDGNVLEASEAVFMSTMLMFITTPILVLIIHYMV